MPTSKKLDDFLKSEEGVKARQELILMTNDSAYNTQASYSANPSLYPNNQIPFVDKHMNYLSAHPNIDPTVYLGNLRLMTRLR